MTEIFSIFSTLNKLLVISINIVIILSILGIKINLFSKYFVHNISWIIIIALIFSELSSEESSFNISNNFSSEVKLAVEQFTSSSSILFLFILDAFGWYSCFL